GRLPVRAALPRCAAGLPRGAAAAGPCPVRRRSALRAIRMTLLSIRDVSVLLGGRKGFLRRTVPPVRAVTDVSLDLKEGEILSLVGESGCGKTTLGRTIVGLQREGAGEISLDGQSVGGLAVEAARQVRKAIQYVHQDAGAALDPWWSIGGLLQEGLSVIGVANPSERQAKVGAMLDAVGLD